MTCCLSEVQITGDAHFVADSELLSKIAQTPYVVEEQKEWTVEAFRVQNTVFLFKGGDLQQRDKARLLESYQREMFRRKFTQACFPLALLQICATISGGPGPNEGR